MKVTSGEDTTHEAESVWREYGHVQNIKRCKLTPERADLLVKGYHNLRLLRKYRAGAMLPQETNVLRCWYPSEDEEEPDHVRVNAQPKMEIEID